MPRFRNNINFELEFVYLNGKLLEELKSKMFTFLITRKIIILYKLKVLFVLVTYLLLKGLKVIKIFTLLIIFRILILYLS